MAVEELVFKISGDSKEGQRAVREFKDVLVQAFHDPQALLRAFGESTAAGVVAPSARRPSSAASRPA